MDSQFEQLNQVLDYTASADEREILLRRMAQVGSFEQLKHMLDYTFHPNERKILLPKMAQAGSFNQLNQVLDYTASADEREILLRRMAQVSSFEQLKHMLDYTFHPNERKILLEAMTKQPKQSKKVTTQTVRQNEGIRRNFRKVPEQPGKQFDVFIAHASEDKSFVTPLALSLRRKGLEVWYDDFVLIVGDSLRREIDRGLAQSRYGIVILSHNFFRKHWPQKELDGLVAREQFGKKIILPVWHDIDKAEVASYSPTLADIVAAKSNEGIEAITNKIIEAISS